MIKLMVLLLFSSTVYAYDENVDVDWDPNRPSGVHVLRITIDGCTTKFKIPDKDFYKFTESNEALQQSIEIAEKRARNGCN